MRESFSGSIKRTLHGLKLDHVWDSQAIGDLKGWISCISATIRKKEQESWVEELKEMDKLRTYRSLKTVLGREDFISWQVPTPHRVLYARLRSGTHSLRMETGRWVHEKEAERLQNLCDW